MIIPINIGMPSADKPFVFVVRGKVPSLKNNRLRDFRPNPEVTQYIQHAKATFRRQLPKGWEIQQKPLRVAYYIRLGVYYLSDLPTSDVDNSVTTLQEAMMETLIEDDNQVAFGAFERMQRRFPEVSSTIFFWLVENDLRTDLNKIFKYIEMIDHVEETNL